VTYTVALHYWRGEIQMNSVEAIDALKPEN